MALTLLGLDWNFLKAFQESLEHGSRLVAIDSALGLVCVGQGKAPGKHHNKASLAHQVVAMWEDCPVQEKWRSWAMQ